MNFHAKKSSIISKNSFEKHCTFLTLLSRCKIAYFSQRSMNDSKLFLLLSKLVGCQRESLLLVSLQNESLQNNLLCKYLKSWILSELNPFRKESLQTWIPSCVNPLILGSLHSWIPLCVNRLILGSFYSWILSFLNPFSLESRQS